MRTVAPGVDQPIQEGRPEHLRVKAKEGEEKCPCGTYAAWCCKEWPVCVKI